MNTITHIDIFAIAQDTPDYSWSPVMPDVLNTDTLVRVTDSAGNEGVGCVCTFTEYGVDKTIIESLRPLVLGLLSSDTLAPKQMWQRGHYRRPGVTNTALAALDFALWDLEAKTKNMPLYQLLGGAKSSIETYASVPILAGPEAYISMIEALQKTGFSRFKFHYKSQASPDLALIEAVATRFSERCEFMFDAENLYNLEEAIAVGRLMQAHEFLWLEAPFDDHDWASYQRLQEAIDLPIIPAGNSVVDHSHIAQALQANCWDHLRLDAATAGGITPMMGIVALAKSHQKRLELQSWGSSLATAANLHLALAHDNSHYFEIPVPRSDFTIKGCADYPLTPEGMILAPDSPGIGLSLDWDVISQTADAHHRYDVSGFVAIK